MRVVGGKEFTIWEWASMAAAIAAVFLLTTHLAVAQKWRDASVYTVLVFVVVATAFRPAWGRLVFWRNFALIFALHVILLTITVQSLPMGLRGLPWLPLTCAGMLEGLFITVVLWKRTARSKVKPSTESE